MVPFWVPIIMRRLFFRVPKKGPYFDNHPCGSQLEQGCPRPEKSVEPVYRGLNRGPFKGILKGSFKRFHLKGSLKGFYKGHNGDLV